MCDFIVGHEEVIKGLDDIFLSGLVTAGETFQITCIPEVRYTSTAWFQPITISIYNTI